MIPTDTSNLKRLLEHIRTIGLWQRLFGWQRIKDQLMAAAADLTRLQSEFEHLAVDRNRLAEANVQLRFEDEKRRQDLDKQLNTLDQYQARILAQREQSFPVTRAIFEFYGRLGDGPYIASAMGVWAMALLKRMVTQTQTAGNNAL